MHVMYRQLTSDNVMSYNWQWIQADTSTWHSEHRPHTD